ncbi:MAG TPA: sterol desaturase family protein [Chitinophagales bacterium]|nr:sterol desaturase family protein [Chitinophagales bacterium]
MDFSNDKISQIVGIIIASVFLTGVVVEYLLSRLLKKNYFSSEFFIINLSIASLQQLTDVLSKVIFLTAFIFVQQHYSIQKFLGWREIEANNPFSPFNPLVLLNYVFVLVVADFCQYWLHRFSHEVNIMWAGHITHHSNSEYNYGVALRQNALENIYTWVFYMPLAFFGIPWQMFVAAYAVSLIWQFLVHTRMVNKLGFLETFMSTPSHHRVHHGKNPQYIDKNYGAFFIIWDKMFGTFEPEVEEVEYGITEPLRNQNPAWSCVHHHVSILKTVRAEPQWKQKMKWIIGKPSKIYADQKSEEEYILSITTQPEKKFYVFINFLLIAIGGFLAVNYYEQTHNVFIYLLALTGVIISFSIFSALLENQHWADYAEVTRLFLIAGAGLLFAFNNDTLIIGVGTIAIAVLLLLFTWFIANPYRRRLAAT